MKRKIIGFLIALVLLLILLLQNTHYTTLHFLFWKKHVQLFILVFIIAAVGFLMGYIAAKMPRRT